MEHDNGYVPVGDALERRASGIIDGFIINVRYSWTVLVHVQPYIENSYTSR